MTRVTSHPKLHTASQPARDPVLDRPTVPAGSTREDVSTFEVNPTHPGNGQTERIGLAHGPIKLAASPLYDGEGNPLGTMSATELGPHHQGGINAGAITELRLKPEGGAPVKCVWVWNVATSKGPGSGWVPLSAVSPRKKVEEIQQAIATRVAQAQGGDSIHHVTRKVVGPSAEALAKVKHLYTFPNQSSDQNKVQYYFGGKTEEPLFLDVPKVGDAGRFGISEDAMPAGTAFHVDTQVPPERVPLYAAKSSEAVANLHFVYGYFVNSAGEKRHGWINGDSLQPEPSK